MKNVSFGVSFDIILFVVGLLVAPAVFAAQDVDQLATQCAACHGADGVSVNPMYPILAGQYANYLEHALKQYHDGERKNAIMNGMAANLSDADIKALAEHFAALRGPLYTPSIRGRIKVPAAAGAGGY